MSLTYYELIDRMHTLDELTLIEMLNISSADLIEAFENRIEARFDQLEAELIDENQSSSL